MEAGDRHPPLRRRGPAPAAAGEGHIIIGQDTDGADHAVRAGLGWAVRMDKPFFVGQRSLRSSRSSGARQKLVGFALGRRDGAPAASRRTC